MHFTSHISHMIQPTSANRHEEERCPQLIRSLCIARASERGGLFSSLLRPSLLQISPFFPPPSLNSFIDAFFFCASFVLGRTTATAEAEADVAFFRFYVRQRRIRHSSLFAASAQHGAPKVFEEK